MIRKLPNRSLVTGVVAVLAIVNLVGCGGDGATNGAQRGGLSQSTVPQRLSPSDLNGLRWIEGAWRGTGDVDKPFYERYRFEGDSALLVESFPDETLSKVDDVTRFELRDGVFGNHGSESRWAATKLDDKSITFEPVERARNTFRWERESEDVWKAVLTWPAAEGAPAKQRVYRMERLPAPKP